MRSNKKLISIVILFLGSILITDASLGFWDSLWFDYDTALVEAASRNDIGELKSFLERGVNPNAKDSKALFVASEKGNIEVIQELLKSGADLNARWSQALVEAAEEGRLAIVEILLQGGVKFPAVDRGIDLENCLGTGASPSLCLIRAIYHQDLQVVEYILEKGEADPDRGLCLAVLLRHVEIVRILLKEGANPNAKCLKSFYIAKKKKNHESVVSRFPEIQVSSIGDDGSP